MFFFRKLRLGLVLVLAASIVGGGCAGVGSDHFAKRTLTVDQVIAIYGQPSRVEKGSDGVDRYYFKHLSGPHSYERTYYVRDGRVVDLKVF